MIETTGLRNVEGFWRFPDGEGEIVAGIWREESLPEGVTLCEEWDQTNKLFILGGQLLP
jgi:hypothetical protein